MLSCSVGSLRNRFPFAQPGRVGGRKGFCSRAIPGPGPSQNPALCGSPPTKCSSALALYWCEGGIPLGRSVLREYPATSTHFRFGQRSCPRPLRSRGQLPCRRSRAGSFRRQRPGSRQSRQPRLRRLHSVVSTPRYGFAVFIYTCPLFLHTSAVVNHAGSVPGVQGQPFRLLAQRMSGSAFGGLWPPRLIALSAHNHAFASTRHPLRRWVPFSLGFAHGRYPFDSALSRAVPARTPEAVCAHILPVFAGGREPGVSRPLYRQSPSFLTRRCYRPPPGPRSTRFARSAPLVVCRL